MKYGRSDIWGFCCVLGPRGCLYSKHISFSAVYVCVQDAWAQPCTKDINDNNNIEVIFKYDCIFDIIDTRVASNAYLPWLCKRSLCPSPRCHGLNCLGASVVSSW